MKSKHSTIAGWEERFEAEHKRTNGYFKYWLVPFISSSIQEAVKKERQRIKKDLLKIHDDSNITVRETIFAYKDYADSLTPLGRGEKS